MFGRDLRRTFRSQFYGLSGDKPPSAGGGFAGGMVPRTGALLPDPPSLPGWITESDVDVYVAEFKQSGTPRRSRLVAQHRSQLGVNGAFRR